MTTHTAWIVLEFCLVVCALALALRQVRRFNPTARRTATRIAVTFGVFALAAGYVWLEIGGIMVGQDSRRPSATGSR